MAIRPARIKKNLGARRGTPGLTSGPLTREQKVDDAKRLRDQRLAAALRANLHRRKQQARRRASADEEPAEPKQSPDDPPRPDRPAGKG